MRRKPEELQVATRAHACSTVGQTTDFYPKSTQNTITLRVDGGLSWVVSVDRPQAAEAVAAAMVHENATTQHTDGPTHNGDRWLTSGYVLSRWVHPEQSAPNQVNPKVCPTRPPSLPPSPPLRPPPQRRRLPGSRYETWPHTHIRKSVHPSSARSHVGQDGMQRNSHQNIQSSQRELKNSKLKHVKNHLQILHAEKFSTEMMQKANRQHGFCRKMCAYLFFVFR